MDGIIARDRHSKIIQGTDPSDRDGWDMGTTNEFGKMFGKKRFVTIIRENASSTSEKILHSIIESLKAFRGSDKQGDVVTLAVVKIVQ